MATTSFTINSTQGAPAAGDTWSISPSHTVTANGNYLDVTTFTIQGNDATNNYGGYGLTGTSVGGTLNMATHDLFSSSTTKGLLTIDNGVIQNVLDINGPAGAVTVDLSNATFQMQGSLGAGDVFDMVSELDQVVFSTTNSVSGGSPPAGGNATLDGAIFEGVQSGDRIGFINASSGPTGTITDNTTTDRLTFTIGGTAYTASVTLSAGAPSSWHYGTFTTASGQTEYYVQDGPAPCFVTGTRILTARGEVPVESLRVGDLVPAFHTGRLQPIRWIGYRLVRTTEHPRPETVNPIRVVANAFGEGLPSRDLWMSPGHQVFVDGVLIPVARLVNGVSVAQVEQNEVCYWNIELESHDVVLAEGLPVETFLDTGNRSDFSNGGDFVEMHPDFMPKHFEDTCAPLHLTGPKVEAVQAHLLQRAAEKFGLAITHDPDVHLLCDGQVIEAESVEGNAMRFRLPGGASDVRLVSRTWVPMHMLPGHHDARTLGVLVRSLVADDWREISLAALDGGWWPPEQDASGPFRWTQGSAQLPVSAETLTVELAGDLTFWVDAPAQLPKLRLVA